MTRPVTDVIEEWLAAGESVALATVVETKRSAPQPVGTKMAVNSSSQVWGSVSGGCVEGAVVEVAEEILEGGAPRLLHYGISSDEAWDVGLPCGGEIAVWVERYGGDGELASFFEIGRSGGRAAIVTLVDDGPARGDKLLVPADRDHVGTLGSDALDAVALSHARTALWSEEAAYIEIASLGASLFVDVIAPAPRLLIVGAIDFAAQLCEAARVAGWVPIVIDPRARFATPERFPAAERVIVSWPDEAFAEVGQIDPSTAIAVLTHDPKLDDAALQSALASDAGYIGAMGSRRAQEQRHARLLDAGVDPGALARVSAPIGLDIGALTSGETALSIMGEIVALKRRRDGGRLMNAAGRIHDIAN